MRILYTRPDGGMSVVNAVTKTDVEKILGPLSDDEYKKHVWDKSVPADAINAVEISDDVQLPDREFRNAWIQNGGSVTHDFLKAKDIQLVRLRVKRDALMIKYDGLQARAQDLEDNFAAADVKVKKQLLRDATNALKALDPKSIDDIKKATPDLEGF